MAEILAVCTGNVCRSPFFEQLLRAELDRVLPAGHGLTAASAGTRVRAGAPLDPRTEVALRDRGVRPVPHGAHLLSGLDVSAADLVLTATREQRTAVVRAHPPALRYSFTALEFARLAALVDPSAVPAAPLSQSARPSQSARLSSSARLSQSARGEDRLGALVRAVAARRGSIAPRPDGDDIADPVGVDDRGYAVIAGQLAAVVETLVAGLDGSTARAAVPTGTAVVGGVRIPG